MGEWMVPTAPELIIRGKGLLIIKQTRKSISSEVGGGAQRPNREIGFVSFVRACARSGCKVAMKVHEFCACFPFPPLCRLCTGTIPCEVPLMIFQVGSNRLTGTLPTLIGRRIELYPEVCQDLDQHSGHE